ncbi:MAG: helix-turn-helix domain-containing protein [Rhodospirillales bacterium]
MMSSVAADNIDIPTYSQEKPEYVNLKAIAKKLGLSYETVRRMARDQEFPTFRRNGTGRILVRRSDFDTYLENNTCPAKVSDRALSESATGQTGTSKMDQSSSLRARRIAGRLNNG